MKKTSFFPAFFLLALIAIFFTSCENTMKESIDELSVTQEANPENPVVYYIDLNGDSEPIEVKNLDWSELRDNSPALSFRSGQNKSSFNAGGKTASGNTIVGSGRNFDGQVTGQIQFVNNQAPYPINFHMTVTCLEVIDNVARWGAVISKVTESGNAWWVQEGTILVGASQDNGEGANAPFDRIWGLWLFFENPDDEFCTACHACTWLPNPIPEAWWGNTPAQVQIRSW